MLDERFGTWRGAVRLALAYAEVGTGLAPVRKPDPQRVRRLVFVCHGNICRSAFAQAAARARGANAASFGLSTVSGKPAHAPVVACAKAFGLDLSDHRTTALGDFVPEEGDYLLAMEVRHLRALAADERLAHLPRALLGSFAAVPVPHLHDPFELNGRYLEVCLRRIGSAVNGLSRAFPGAGAS